jgi:general secretion pathway protein I
MSTRPAEPAAGEAGFTITESLVALFVFALAGVALVQMQTQSVMTFTRVEARTLAGIIAENQLVEAMAKSGTPAMGRSEGDAELGGKTWRWRLDVAPTDDPATLRIAAQAFAKDAEDASATVYAFRDSGGRR